MNSPPFLIKDEMKNSGVDLDDIYEVWSKLGVNDSPNARILILKSPQTQSTRASIITLELGGGALVHAPGYWYDSLTNY